MPGDDLRGLFRFGYPTDIQQTSNGHPNVSNRILHLYSGFERSTFLAPLPAVLACAKVKKEEERKEEESMDGAT